MYPVPTSFDRKLEKCINLRWGLFLLFNPRIKFVYFRKWKIKLPFVTEIQVSWWTSLSPSFGLHLGWLWDKNKQKKSINNKWIVICADIDWRKLQKTLFIVHCISSHYYWENKWINDLFWSKKKRKLPKRHWPFSQQFPLWPAEVTLEQLLSGRGRMDAWERSHMTKLLRAWKPGSEDGRFWGANRWPVRSCIFSFPSEPTPPH